MQLAVGVHVHLSRAHRKRRQPKLNCLKKKYNPNHDIQRKMPQKMTAEVLLRPSLAYIFSIDIEHQILVITAFDIFAI